MGYGVVDVGIEWGLRDGARVGARVGAWVGERVGVRENLLRRFRKTKSRGGAPVLEKVPQHRAQRDIRRRHRRAAAAALRLPQ